MDVNNLNGWVTLIGAVIAAVAGVWNLALQFRGTKDKFKVRLGTATPQIRPETFLHIVSLSDHPIVIADYGFIEEKEKFWSFRLELDADPSLGQGDSISYNGSPNMAKRSEIFEVGMEFRDVVIGAFAHTITQDQKHTTLWFQPGVSWWKRLRLRLRVRVRRRGLYN